MSTGAERDAKGKGIELVAKGKGVELVAKAANVIAGGPLSDESISIVSSYGQKVWDYWMTRDTAQARVVINDFETARGAKFPPFMVIGLGRCGSHITGTLAEIVAAAKSQNRQEENTQQAEPERRGGLAGFISISRRSFLLQKV